MQGGKTGPERSKDLGASRCVQYWRSWRISQKLAVLQTGPSKKSFQNVNHGPHASLTAAKMAYSFMFEFIGSLVLWMLQRKYVQKFIATLLLDTLRTDSSRRNAAVEDLPFTMAKLSAALRCVLTPLPRSHLSSAHASRLRCHCLIYAVIPGCAVV